VTGPTVVRPRKPAAPKVTRRKGPPKEVNPRSGRALRQTIPTGTVAEVEATIRRIGLPVGHGHGHGPMNGPALARTAGDELAADPACTTVEPRIDDVDVLRVIDLIDRSGLVEWAEERQDARKKKSGRPPMFGFRALFVAMMLAARTRSAMHGSMFRRILHLRISPAMRAELGVAAFVEPLDKRKQRLAVEAANTNVRRAFHRFLATVDPSIHQKGKARPWVELAERARPLTLDEQMEMQAALDIAANTIVGLPYDALPERTRRRHDGSACIDGTGLPLFSVGRPVDSETASSDPDGGYRVRTGDHSEDSAKDLKEAEYGLEVHLVVAGDATLGDRQYMPAVPWAMTVDRPAKDPSGAARRLFGNLVARGCQPNYLAGDGLYTLAEPEKFQIPAREAGFRLVLSYPDGHTGKQDAHDGMLLVEGRWACGAMPPELVNATEDVRAGLITMDEYHRRISERAAFDMRVQNTADANGNLRVACGASGPCAPAKCVIKPESLKKRPINTSADGVKFDGRPRIDPPEDMIANPPKACRQRTITVHKDKGARYLQDLRYGSPEQTDVYNALRQAQEGFHGFAKDEAEEALGAAGNRRIRGKAAQTMMAAFLIAAAGLRKVDTFMREAQVDEHGDLYVIRRPRSDQASPPPGTKRPTRKAA
jgi:hypothetical protein